MTDLRALVIGDPHFKKNNVSDSEDFAKASIKTARTQKPDIIVVLGDVLDTHESSNMKPQQQATEWLSTLSEIAPLYILIGNHDRPHNATYLTKESFFTALKKWPNTYIIDQPLLTTIKGQKYIFVPYVPNGRFMEALRTLDEKDVSDDKATFLTAKCIFAHQEFKGVKMGLMVSSNGDKWSIDWPLIITGHIHEYSKPQSNIIYVGTPRQNAFDESPDKAITLFTFADKLKEERIDLGLRKKKEVELTVEELETEVKLPDNCDLKIIITGRVSEIKTVKKLSIIKEWRKKGYKVITRDLPDFEDKDKGVNIVAKADFSKLLLSKCDNELKQEFEEIFGLTFEPSRPKPRVRIT